MFKRSLDRCQNLTYVSVVFFHPKMLNSLARESGAECSLAQHRFPIRFVSFFLSVLCVFLCVRLWWIKTRLSFAVASHIGHNVFGKEEKKA